MVAISRNWSDSSRETVLQEAVSGQPLSASPLWSSSVHIKPPLSLGFSQQTTEQSTAMRARLPLPDVSSGGWPLCWDCPSAWPSSSPSNAAVWVPSLLPVLSQAYSLHHVWRFFLPSPAPSPFYPSRHFSQYISHASDSVLASAWSGFLWFTGHNYKYQPYYQAI